MRVNLNTGAGYHEYCITGGPESKFEIWEKHVLEAYKKAFEKGVREYGIHTHIGSNILDPKPLLRATEKLLDIAGEIRRELGIEFKFIDIGGGMGIPYKPEEKEFNIDLFSEGIVNLFREKIEKYDLGQPYLYIEPGDILIILNVGAYGFAMSSHYNSRLLPPEILVNNGKYDIIREREDFKDLLRHQKYAKWLNKDDCFKEG